MQAILALELNRIAPATGAAPAANARLTVDDASAVRPLSFGLKQHSATELRAELRSCQQRLGTAAERPDDLDWARALAHEINNRRQVEYLRALLALDDGGIEAALGMTQLVA